MATHTDVGPPSGGGSRKLETHGVVDLGGAHDLSYWVKALDTTPEALRAAKPDCIVMHPGPMNRGVEIDSRVADGARSVILPQVTFGIAVRMAVLSIAASSARFR